MQIATRINATSVPKLFVSTVPLAAHHERAIARGLRRGKNKRVKIGSALNPNLSLIGAAVYNRSV